MLTTIGSCVLHTDALQRLGEVAQALGDVDVLGPVRGDEEVRALLDIDPLVHIGRLNAAIVVANHFEDRDCRSQ